MTKIDATLAAAGYSRMTSPQSLYDTAVREASAFTRGYVECALEQSTDGNRDATAALYQAAAEECAGHLGTSYEEGRAFWFARNSEQTH